MRGIVWIVMPVVIAALLAAPMPASAAPRPILLVGVCTPFGCYVPAWPGCVNGCVRPGNPGPGAPTPPVKAGQAR